MIRRLIFSAICCGILFNARAQFSKEYPEWIKKAEAAYQGKQYLVSGRAYNIAFASNGDKGAIDDRYNAACAWAMAGNKDSAFFMLERITTRANYADLSHLQVDGDLTSLHSDKRWDKLCELVKQNKDKAEANLDKHLVAMLDTIMILDQGGRQQIDKIAATYGRNSKEMDDLWKTIKENDSENLVKVEMILGKYGWVGPDVAGWQGNNAIFLVIQHADIKTQEKYLPMMRDAVKNKKAQASSLALLEDRVALRQGRKQIYGSQITLNKENKYYVDILEDPDNVDKRRAEVGLQPLTEYVQHWGITWDAEAYKKQLPELEKRKMEEMKNKR